MPLSFAVPAIYNPPFIDQSENIMDWSSDDEPIFLHKITSRKSIHYGHPYVHTKSSKQKQKQSKTIKNEPLRKNKKTSLKKNMSCTGNHVVYNHGLKIYKNPIDDTTFSCDECDKIFAKGTTVHACRSCNFDLCSDCYRKAMKQKYKAATNQNKKQLQSHSKRFFQEKNKLKNYKRGIHKNEKQKLKNKRNVIKMSRSSFMQKYPTTIFPPTAFISKNRNTPNLHGYTVWPRSIQASRKPSKKIIKQKHRRRLKLKTINSNKVRNVKYNSFNRMMFLLNKIKSHYGSGKPSFEEAVNIVGVKSAKQLVVKNLIYQKKPIFQNPRSLSFREKDVYYEQPHEVNNWQETLDNFHSYSLHSVF